MKNLICGALLGAMLFSARAQPSSLPNGTVDVYFQQLSRDGILDGCSLVFTSLVQDHAYLKGDQVLLNGSFAFRNLKDGQMSFTGKLGTKPMNNLNAQFVAPAHFYFSTATGTTAGIAKVFDGETPGYRLLVADALRENILAMIKDLYNKPEFVVGFNRRSGGQDVYSVVKLDVSLKQDGSVVSNAETAQEFRECLGTLAQRVKSQLNKK